jgi:tripartite ATP-independent transporter DctP family solute receptor
MKKIVALSFVAVLAFTLFACGGKKQAEKVIKIGIVVPASQSFAVAINDKFKDIVESKSDGKFEVQLFPDGVLGGERELYDSVKEGNIDMIVIGSYFYNEVPQVLITDFPFLYRDADHAQAVYNSPEVGGVIAEALEARTGIKLIAWGPNGVRSFSSAKPLEKVADFKGQRIRMPNNKIHIALAKALGANVVTMAMGDIFTSLEQKVIDGQDNPLRTLVSYGWYEVQKYVYETNHMVASLELMVSPQFWATLTPEEQTMMLEAAKETSDYAWDHYRKSIAEDEQFLKENGLTVTVPTDEEKAQMQQLVVPLYNSLYAEYPWAKDLVAKAKAIK